jgi:hypothetical protein
MIVVAMIALGGGLLAWALSRCALAKAIGRQIDQVAEASH